MIEIKNNNILHFSQRDDLPICPKRGYKLLLTNDIPSVSCKDCRKLLKVKK